MRRVPSMRAASRSARVCVRGVARMVSVAATRIGPRTESGSTPEAMASVPSRKENSPICVIAPATVVAAGSGTRSASSSATMVPPVPSSTASSVASEAPGIATIATGSTSAPTETKNSATNMRCSGTVSAAAWWPRGLSPSSTPAKKAPSAGETPNIAEDPKAVPNAITITARVNNSRDPVPATRPSSRGSSTRPPNAIAARNPASSSAVRPSLSPRFSDAPAITGSSTSASTTTRSCTTSQPSAMRPASPDRRPLSSSARVETAVEEMASARPKTGAAAGPSPSARAPAAAPISVPAAICASAPGSATRQTASRSRARKCSPTAKSRSATPISASAAVMAGSATKPGVWGPTAMPAAM